MTSISSILNGAFGLVRDRPVTVLVWCGIYLAVTVGSALFWLPIQAQMMTMGTNSRALDDLPALFVGFGLFGLAALLVQMILLTAAYRAVLRPGDGRFAFLRFGMDELRETLLAIVMIVAFYALIVAGALVIGVGAAFLGRGGTAGIVLAVLLGLILTIAFLCLVIWLAVRLCLAFPLTLLRRRFVIGEAWRLSKGRFWTLFGAFIAIFFLYFICSVVVSSVTAASYMSALANGGLFAPGKDPAVQQAAFIRQFTTITPVMVIGWIFGGLLGGAFMALNGGATATAVRDLTVDDGELIERFS